MRIRYEKIEPRGTLPLIPEIPDCRACQLEGLNGIGKSLALRLMQLATGGQPYLAHAAAWESLRSHLGNVRIIADEIPGPHRIEWLLTPEKWPADPTTKLDGNLGTIVVDGKQGNLDQVQKLVSFERFGGDEGLAESIANHMSADRAVVEAWQRQIEENGRPVLALIDGLQETLAAPTTEQLGSGQTRADEASVAHRRALEAFNELLGAGQQVREVEGLRSLLEDVRKAVPSVEGEIDELDTRLADLNRQIKSLEQERAGLLEKVTRAEDTRKKLKLAEGRLRGAQKRVDQGTLAVRAEIEALELGAGPDALAAAMTQARDQLEALEATIRDIEVGPRLRDLLDYILGGLVLPGMSTVSSQIVAVLDDERRLRADELERAMRRRSAEVSVAPTSAEAAHITQAIARFHTRLERLRSLRQDVEVLDAERRKADAADKRVRELRRELSGPTAQKLEELDRGLERLRGRHLEASIRRGTLVRQRADLELHGSLGQLQERYSRALAALGLTAHQLEVRLADAEAREQAAQSELHLLRANAEAAQNDLVALEAAVGLAVQRSESEISRKLLDTISERARPSRALTVLENAGRLDVLRQRVELVLSRFDALRRILSVIPLALDELAEGVRATAVPQPAKTIVATVSPSIVAALRKRYEEEFGDRLRSPEVAEALFDAGRFEALDLQRQSVSWIGETGQRLTRPLDAFSSGQRAFAYTLARLRGEAEVAASHRVIVLDEFGAFVDRDHFGQLARFINSHVLGKSADQVLVVLPFRGDPELLPESERQEFDERHYVVRDLTSQ